MTVLVAAPSGSPLRRTMPPGFQRVGPLSEIPGLLREFGVRPVQVLRRVGLAPDALADRDARIPYATATVLLDACARATRCAHFGLLVGARWRLEHVGLVGEYARSCATVGQALEAFTAFQWTNSSGGVTFLGREKGVTTLGYAVFEPGVEAGVDHVGDMTTAIGVRMVRELSGRPEWAPLQVLLARAKPADVRPYRQYLHAPIRFDAEASLLHFRSADEALPVPGSDETRRRMLEAKLAAAGRESIVPRLHRMVRVAMLFGFTSGDDVAAAMSLNRRTFNRRLAGSGTTFQQVLANVRYEVARQLLRDTALSIAEIAQALGYAEPSPFVRAFRRWSGVSPGQWRRDGNALAAR